MKYKRTNVSKIANNISTMGDNSTAAERERERESGLSQLYSADDNAVAWLISYGS